jgi:hypothetical protein
VPGDIKQFIVPLCFSLISKFSLEKVSCY